MNIDRAIGQVKCGKVLKERHVCQLLREVKSVFVEEPNVLRVLSPVKIVGNICGHFEDLLKLFRLGGEPTNYNPYVFLGGYVNRGIHSVLTITLLFLLKLKYPNSVFLLRGSHECRNISKVYGFYDEVKSYYGNGRAWELCMEAFDMLPIAAVIDGKIFCVHSGISPKLSSVESLQTVQRYTPIFPREGVLNDLLWAEPVTWNHTGWSLLNRRDWAYGKRVVREFLELNDLKMICRTHSLHNDGYKYDFENLCLSIWSAPNYCYRCGNLGGFVEVCGDLSVEIETFEKSYMNRRIEELRRDVNFCWDNLDMFEFVYRERTERYWKTWEKVQRSDSLERNSYLIGKAMAMSKDDRELFVGDFVLVLLKRDDDIVKIFRVFKLFLYE